MSCIFCDIVAKKIKNNLVLETDQLIAFKDIAPQAPVHLLIVPKRHVATLNDLGSAERPADGPDGALLVTALIDAVKRLAREFKVDQSGYRTVINCNQEGGQSVYHLHVHLLGGRQLGGSMVG